MTMARFANILLTGSCNQRCPHCIGRVLAARALPDNLDRFPLLNLEPFLDLLVQEGIQEISLTGTNTDPQLYPHEAALLDRLRDRLPGVRLSLHTNGRLALAKIDVFNRYDRATISIPSFRPETIRNKSKPSTVQTFGVNAVSVLAPPNGFHTGTAPST